MASPASPRDHVADANPDLSRKRQRLSEERSSLGSQPGSPTVEELPVDDSSDATMVNSVTLLTGNDNDFDNIEGDGDDMELYSSTFDFVPDESPVSQITTLLLHPIDPETINYLCCWLKRHLKTSSDEGPHIWLQRYTQDEAFFGNLADLLFKAVERAGTLTDNDVASALPSLDELTFSLVESSAILSARIVHILDMVTKGRLSRRDSVQAASGQQEIELLNYTWLLAHLLCDQPACFLQWKNQNRQETNELHKACKAAFHKDPQASKSLTTVFRQLSWNHQSIKHSWIFIHSVLKIARTQFTQHIPLAENILEDLSNQVVHAATRKHPRSIPDGFHEFLAYSRTKLLRICIKDRPVDFCATLFQKFIKSDEDAMQSDARCGEADPKIVWDIYEQEPQAVEWLLELAFQLQTCKAYILSDIIDVRTCGIILLSKNLINLYNGSKQTGQGIAHPVAQYAARFLRTNEITKYIFSADSHASLVMGSNHIIGFLAVSQSFTDQETDIIWQACSTSVEAEFVKASVHVLKFICRFLSFDHLRYAISCYCTTPVSNISIQAIELLPDLFHHLHARIPDEYGRECRLSAANLAVDIFKHVSSQGQSSATQRLEATVTNEIVKAATTFNEADRIATYQSCVTDIVESNDQTTTSMRIVCVFLEHGMKDTEAKQLLQMLPFEVVVGEIGQFVQDNAHQTPESSSIRPIDLSIRLTLAAHLLDHVSFQDSTASQDMLYNHLFGEQAGHNGVRDYAWGKLEEIALSREGPRAAEDLMNRYLDCHVSTLPAKYATPSLIRLLGRPIERLIRADALNNGKPSLLDNPLWKCLVRFASETTWEMTVTFAIDLICNLLLYFPLDLDSKVAALQCQSDFVRDYVGHLSKTFYVIEDPNQSQIFCQSMRLLQALFTKSKDTEALFRPSKQSNVIKLGDLSNRSEVLHFTLHVDTSRIPHSTVDVEANHSITMSQLMELLPTHTAALENKIIVQGLLIDITIDGPKPLSQIGIPNSGGIMVCPKHTFESDVNKILTHSGPVESAIMEQYDTLSNFVDGPFQVARSAFDLLARLPPSMKARIDVASNETLSNLFPVDRLWRTRLSVSILERHLKDLAVLGVAHADYISRGISLLTSYILDSSQRMNPDLLCSLLDCLVVFLREKPTAPIPHISFDRPQEFESKLVQMSFKVERTLQQVADGDSESGVHFELALSIYQTLLQACATDLDVWKAFIDDKQARTLITDLIMNDNSPLATRFAEMTINFCQHESSPSDARRVFWNSLYSALPTALKRPNKARPYFRAMVDLLDMNSDMRSDGYAVRDLMETLTSTIWEYIHIETVECPLSDEAMVGTLQLLANAVSMLKASSLPLHLDNLAPTLFEKFLFPRSEESNHPLLSPETRKLVYDIVKASCTSTSDYQELCNLTRLVIELPDDSFTSGYPGDGRLIRSPYSCSGLSNLGMTCYMNSLLQQIFANLSFRKFIFDTPVVDTERQALLAEVQRLFAGMQNAKRLSTNTSALAEILGIKVDSQEDVHGFYATFLSALEDAMPDADSRTSLKHFFTGNFISQIRGDCGHVSTQTEPFMDLSITIKNKLGLKESLDEFVQGEPMRGANKYRCLTCDPENGGALVDAMKRTCLEDIPDNLTLCLKRFTFEAMMGLEGKVNDRFEFPPEINMANYHRSHLEDPEQMTKPDNFELVGVIVHQGDLAFGHYWSYVRLGKGSDVQPATWICLEDSIVRPCSHGIEQVQEECFGGKLLSNGNARTDNAYVLIYQRASSAQEQLQLMEPTLNFPHLTSYFPPRVTVPRAIASAIDIGNRVLYRVEHLFSSDLLDLTEWLLSSYNPSTRLLSEHYPPDQTENSPDIIQMSEADKTLPSAAFRLLFRVRLLDPCGHKRLSTFVPLLKRIISDHPSFAFFLLQEMAKDPGPFLNTWRYPHAQWRKQVSGLITQCIISVKQNHPSAYCRLLGGLLKAHASMKRPVIDEINAHWTEYFGLVGDIATMGPSETSLVLDAGSLKEVLDILILFMTKDVNRTSLYTMINRSAVDMAPLFVYLNSVLSNYVDFDRRNTCSPHLQRTVENERVRLSDVEWNSILASCRLKGYNIWALGYMAAEKSTATKFWQDFAAGKFVALIADTEFRSEVLGSLLNRYEHQDEHLEPLLQITLHICSRAEDSPGDIDVLFTHLSRDLLLWLECELKACLAFWREAYMLVPRRVIESLPKWAPQYLLNKSRQCRRLSGLLLKNCLLVDPPTDFRPSEPDARRMNITRKLVTEIASHLEIAYRGEEERTKYNEAIDFLASVFQWQIQYTTAVKEHVQEIAFCDRTMLDAELFETRISSTRLDSTLTRCKDWTADEDNEVRFRARKGRIIGDEEDECNDTSEEEEEEESSYEDIGSLEAEA